MKYIVLRRLYLIQIHLQNDLHPQDNIRFRLNLVWRQFETIERTKDFFYSLQLIEFLLQFHRNNKKSILSDEVVQKSLNNTFRFFIVTIEQLLNREELYKLKILYAYQISRIIVLDLKSSQTFVDFAMWAVERILLLTVTVRLLAMQRF